MTTPSTAGAAPVRQSPLAAEHARLGARWISDRAQWPATYGAPDRERETVRSAAGLVDLGPLVKLSVTAPDVAAALRPLGLTGSLGAIVSGRLAGIAVNVWFLAPDEALVVHPPADPGDVQASLATVAALRVAGLTPVELSSGTAALVLAGPAARLVLGDCFPVDVHPGALPDRHHASGSVAGILAVVGRLDRDGAPSFTLLVARDLAVSLWTALLEIGAMHGLAPVGVDALSGSAS